MRTLFHLKRVSDLAVKVLGATLGIMILTYPVERLAAEPADKLVLITAEEAKLFQSYTQQLDTTTNSRVLLQERGFFDGAKGPNVELLKPKVEENNNIILKSPASLHMRFLETENPVNPDSLEITIGKFLLSLDITERLRPYLKGNEIEASEVAIDATGTYDLKLSIADIKGNKTDMTYVLVVEQ